MTRSDLATAIAVLAGSGLIALVLSRGLDRVADALKQGQRSAPAVPVAGVPTSVVPAPLGAAAPAPTAAAPETPEARQNRIQEQAQFALARQRPDYVGACWKPPAPVPGQPPDLGGAFELEITFDEGGMETARTVLSGGYAHPPLLACVRATKVPRLRIDPPGAPIKVTVNMPVP